MITVKKQKSVVRLIQCFGCLQKADLDQEESLWTETRTVNPGSDPVLKKARSHYCAACEDAVVEALLSRRPK